MNPILNSHDGHCRACKNYANYYAPRNRFYRWASDNNLIVDNQYGTHDFEIVCNEHGYSLGSYAQIIPTSLDAQLFHHFFDWHPSIMAMITLQGDR